MQKECLRGVMSSNIFDSNSYLSHVKVQLNAN